MPILEKGDAIRIVSTARKISESELRETIQYIESKGFLATKGEHLYSSENQFAGADKARLEELLEALEDPSI